VKHSKEEMIGERGQFQAKSETEMGIDQEMV